MGKVYLAAYKGRKAIKKPYDLVARFADWATRRLTKGIYSHCELVVPLGGGRYRCYSSSLRDGGVRIKEMPLPDDRWDLVEVDITPAKLQAFFNANGGRYDTLGALGVRFGLRQSPDKWFCSEWCAAALGLPQPHRESPVSLWKKVGGGHAD